MYKIGDVAKLTGIKVYTIRFWAANFPHIKSINSKSKTRYYDVFCIKEFIKIKELMQIHKIKLDGIKDMVQNGEIVTKKSVKIKAKMKSISKGLKKIDNESNEKRANLKTKKRILSKISDIKRIIKHIVQQNEHIA